jgi:hypothetical protein
MGLWVICQRRLHRKGEFTDNPAFQGIALVYGPLIDRLRPLTLPEKMIAMQYVSSENAIFSWVPEPLIRDAQAGIDANIVNCIHWCDWSELSKSG